MIKDCLRFGVYCLGRSNPLSFNILIEAFWSAVGIQFNLAFIRNVYSTV